MDPGADPGRTHGRAQATALTTAYGLTFRSDIAVPFRPAPPRAAPDVIIRGGAAPRGLDRPATRFGRWEAAPGALLLTVEDVARYFVRDGREIVVDSIGSERDVLAFLLGSALAACLQQRGVFTLHASAVETEYGAALFAGERGAGKSTLAAALIDRGFRLMADDVTGIVVQEDRPVALPAFPSMRLWGDAMEKLGRRSTDCAKVRANAEKYKLPVERFCDSPLPVCAIIVLSLHNRDGIRLEAVPPVPAFEALLRHTYRKRFVHAMARLQEQYRATTALARHAPLFTLVRPVEQGDPAPLADAVERRLRTLTGAERGG